MEAELLLERSPLRHNEGFAEEIKSLLTQFRLAVEIELDWGLGRRSSQGRRGAQARIIHGGCRVLNDKEQQTILTVEQGIESRPSKSADKKRKSANICPVCPEPLTNQSPAQRKIPGVRKPTKSKCFGLQLKHQRDLVKPDRRLLHLSKR